MRLRELTSLLALTGACSAERPPIPLGPPVPPLPPVNQHLAAAAPVAHSNAGGLFMPEQIGAVLPELQRLGLKVDPAALSDPLSPLLASIVNLGGCSASFVSAGGLIATNHHCAILALQYNSTPASNLLHDGFLAASPNDERSAGPTARVYVTRALRDVSAEVRAALAAEKEDLARERALEKYEKTAVAGCEQPQNGIRCELKSFYGGLHFYLIEKLELRDVRLVYAPPSGIGNYGGEVDNWRWPRHTGDFALFRAYVGPGGAPADHGDKNVPYRPPHHLELAKKPLAEGDLAIVAGYPGRTSALAVAKEVAETVGWTYPRRLKMFDAYLAAVEAAGASDPEVKIKGTPWTRRFDNFRTKHRGELEGFERAHLLERKRADEAALRAFIAADPQRRERAGGALDAIDQAIDERDRKREADTELQAEILMPRLVWAATVIVRMAEERQKPDVDRDPDYQERRVPDRRDELDGLEARFNPKLDQAMLTLALERALATPEAERTPALALIAGPKPTPESIRAAVARLYAGTKLADAKRRRELFDKATPAALARSADSMLRLGVALRPLLKDVEDRQDRFTGKMLLEEPRYTAALLEQKGGRVAPDANGTLRLSFGVVSRPPQGGAAFTWLSEVVKKNTNEEPVAAPRALLDAAAQRDFGAYADLKTGDVPVDFLTDLQITNGNSGSATLDAEGRLIGLAFDGTYESVASDWVFLPTTRSIHVDVRYLLWVLERVSHADAVLAELGVKR
ncbi:MAG TPA: S46 family peptidase [Polyangiaceae bacterium]|nr:S46 family peptidase [Polyangiaceae bacterium]